MAKYRSFIPRRRAARMRAALELLIRDVAYKEGWSSPQIIWKVIKKCRHDSSSHIMNWTFLVVDSRLSPQLRQVWFPTCSSMGQSLLDSRSTVRAAAEVNCSRAKTIFRKFEMKLRTSECFRNWKWWRNCA